MGSRSNLRFTKQFKRDLERMQRRGKAMDKLWDVIDLIEAGESLPTRHRPHFLVGEMGGMMECHIEPDWLLIWEVDDEGILYVNTGTHSDLFH